MISKAYLKIGIEYFKNVSPDTYNIINNIPAYDFLYILFSLLQEHSLIIVSKYSYVTT